MELSHWGFVSDMAFNNYEKLCDYYFGIILLSYWQYLANPKDKLCLYSFISRFRTVLQNERVLNYNSIEVGCYVKFSL